MASHGSNQKHLHSARSRSKRRHESPFVLVSQVEIFEEAGHALFVDEPERFSTLLAGFLAKNELTAPAPINPPN